MSTPTPRAIALLKAVALAADTASRSKDTRFHLEAQVIKHQLKAEIERVPGAPPRTRRSDKASRW
jgi:hypothetical protein